MTNEVCVEVGRQQKDLEDFEKNHISVDWTQRFSANKAVV